MLRLDCAGRIATCCLGLAVVGWSDDRALAGDNAAPALQIAWSVDGNVLNVALPPGSDLRNGTYGFQGTDLDVATGLALNYTFLASSTGVLDGNVSLANDLDQPVEVSIGVSLPTAGNLVSGSDLTAYVTAGLTTGPGGGSIASQAPALWRMTADGQVVGTQATLFHHPFMLSNGGVGTSSTTQNFGVAEPVPGPPISDSIGFEVAFTVSELDTAAVSTSLVVDGCSGDLDGDGLVGVTDLGVMLQEWGPCANQCAADLDLDGEVAVTDFLLLLGNWGLCP